MKNLKLDHYYNYKKALSILKTKGIRPTSQRKQLAKIIFEKGNRHLNAEDLFSEAKKLNYKISLATIYNTLKQFSSYGLLKEIVVDQNKSMYCNNHKPHYHMYIEDEEKIIDIPSKSINLSNIPQIPACLNLHNIDIIVRIRTLKEGNTK
tara:strand:- start:110 stop:559 length:450 start_codon:yes stop_codon:yes gene_type:complete